MKWKASYYIAHSVLDRHWVRDVVMPALIKIGVRPISPFYRLDGSPRSGAENVEAMDAGTWDPYNCTPDDSEKIALEDLRKVSRNNGVIIFINKLGIGRVCEAFYCSYVLGKPVIAVTDTYTNHPWLVFMVHRNKGFVASDLEDLINKLKVYKKEG